MKFRRKPLAGVYSFLFLCFVLVANPDTAWAEHSSSATGGVYISPSKRGLRPSYSKSSISSPYLSFNGLSSFPIGSEDGVSKVIRSGPGFRLGGGWQISEELAVEFSYMASTHEVDMENHDARGFFQGLSLDFVMSPAESNALFTPFMSVGGHGLGFSDGQVTSSKLSGYGVKLGFGTSVLLKKKTSLFLKFSYLGTFVHRTNEDYFGDRANATSFLNTITPEMGLLFHF